MLIDPKKSVEPRDLAKGGPELRLIMQCSVPLEDVTEGETFYKILKEIIKNHSEKSTVNGQIMKMLEPCCDKKSAAGRDLAKGEKEVTHAEKNT